MNWTVYYICPAIQIPEKLKDLESYFKPLPPEVQHKKYPLDHLTLADHSKLYLTEFPYWENADLVIIGCDEDRGSKEMSGAGLAPDLIRKSLYNLSVPKMNARIVDLGNLARRDRMVDYYKSLAEVVSELVRKGKVVLILGGSQDITYGQYMGYEKVSPMVEYVHIDSELDVQDSDFGINNHSFNHKIFTHSPNYLFNFTNLGFQSYFVSQSDRKRLKNLYFNAVRLGDIRADIREAEPFLRNANLVSADISAVRSSDAPGASHPGPAGFTAEEMCQLMRYAGLSNRVSSLSLSEAHPRKDFNTQTTLLAGMMAWYFIEGVLNRRADEPDNFADLQKYRVAVHSGAQDLVFYYNNKSDRWWMEVPYVDSLGKENPRVEVLPCSEQDFLQAKEDEIPVKWWLAHHKLK